MSDAFIPKANRKYDLYSHDFKKNPHPTLAKMRRDNPIFLQVGLDGQTPIWFVSRYEDVDAMLRDPRFVRDERRFHPNHQPSPVEELVGNHMLNKDGDDHRRLRTLVSKAFTPKRIEVLKPRVQEIANELIAAVKDKGKMDLIANFSFHLPTIVILEMLGIPTEDRHKFKVWSQALIDPFSEDSFTVRMTEFTDYLRVQFIARKKEPKDDLMTALLEAEEAGDSLSEGELFSTFVLLIVAGHETTMNLIGNAVLALFREPEKMQQLRNDPGLMKDAVEEFLRFDGPVERALNRWAAEDMVYQGHDMKKGDPVILILNSANQDEAMFAKADRLDIERQQNKHLAFGKGLHYCMGAPLARLEAGIALNTLLAELPNLRLAIPEDDLRWRLTPGFRGFETLPVVWD